MEGYLPSEPGGGRVRGERWRERKEGDEDEDTV
jgi:hypothetical protein